MADESTRYTAFCGICCLDCIPSDRQLFAAVAELKKRLSEVQFEKYAGLKSTRIEVFKAYPTFIDVLNSIAALECRTPCREGGGPADCAIRDCCLRKHYEGCWACSDNRTCPLLVRIKSIHANTQYHLDLISKVGLENWLSQRRAHYSWD